LLDTYNPDVVFGTESRLKPDILSSEVFPEGYNNCELVAYEIKLQNNGSLTVLSAYQPPSSSVDYLNQLCAHLETIKSNHPNSTIWLSGDLNLSDINWEGNCVDGHQYSLNHNNSFLELLSNNGLN